MQDDLSVGLKFAVSEEFEHDGIIFMEGSTGTIESFGDSSMNIRWNNDGNIDCKNQWDNDQDTQRWSHPTSHVGFLKIPDTDWKQFLDL